MTTHFLPSAVESFAAEYTRCTRCSSVLCKWDFGTDDLGRTLEVCPRCGPKLLTVRHDVPVDRARGVSEPKVIGKCQCGVPLVYSGNGGVPDWCPECRAKRKHEGNLERNRARRARTKQLLTDFFTRGELEG